MPSTSSDLTLVVNSFNRKNLLERALRSVYGALAPLPAEVIVVDDGSTDGSRELVQEWIAAGSHPGLRLICPPERVFFAGGVNLGILEARSPFVCLFETDNVALDAGLWEVVEHLKANPRVAAAGVRVVRMDGAVGASSQAFPRALAFALGQRLSALLRLEQGPSGRRREIVYSSPLVVSRAALARVGLMDCARFPFSDSDIEWTRRMAEVGYEVHVLDEVACVHDQGGQVSEFSRKRVRDFHRARLAYFRLYHPQVVPGLRVALLLRHLGELAVFTVMWILGRMPVERVRVRLELIRTLPWNYR